MKKRTLNEYRQTKEYQGSSEGRKYLNDLDPVKQVMAQQIDEELESQPWDTSKYGGGFKDLTKEEKLEKLEKAHKMPEEIKEITLKQQIEDIAERVKDRVHNVLFNEIFEIMDYYDELNWGHFVQDDAPEALLDACMDHKQGIHYEIYQLVLKKLK